MRRQRGFTLIETTVAMALMAIIVVTILSAFSAVTIAAGRHQQETTLDRLTRSYAEYVKSQLYDPNANYPKWSVSGFLFNYTIQHYNKNSNPQFSPTNTDTGLQEIILTVTGPNGITEQLDFLKESP
jgi:prepilin-type N-terminal cleavage/methylation domain-containing protein